MKGFGIGVALVALASSAALAGQKPVIPKGWGEVTSHSPAISFYLPSGWRWADLTLNGPGAPGSMVLMVQARGPRLKNSPRVTDSVMVTGTPAANQPLSEENLKAFADGLQKLLPNGHLVKQSIVDVAGEKGYLVHMQLPVQGDAEGKQRAADQYTYLVPGKKFDYHVVYTFISGTGGSDELQQQSIATFTMKD